MRKCCNRLISFILASLLVIGTVPFSFISFADVVSVWDGTVATAFESGSGTSSDPYIIANASQLAYFASKVNGGTTYKGKYIKLTADICLNDESFSFNPDTGLIKMTDGINFAFLTTRINGDDSGSNTLFDEKPTPGGYMLASDTSKNTGTYSGDLNNWTAIGNSSAPFKGNFDGGNHTVSGLYVKSYSDNGLFGYIYDASVKNIRLENSYVCGSSAAGGITGIAYGAFKIENCANGAFIASSSQDTSWTNKYKYGTGGIVGRVLLTSTGNAKISKCFNMATVSNSCFCAGGIVGNVDAYETTNSSNKSITIENCYNSGLVYTYDRNVGGIVGYVRQIEYIGADLITCYNVGIVRGSSYGCMEGSLAGEYNVYDAMTYTNCYYQMQSPYDYPVTASYSVDDAHGGNHLSINGSKQQSNYVGFDFDTVWEMNTEGEYPYPTLRGMEHTASWEEIEYTIDNGVWDGETVIPIIEGNGTENDPYLITCPAQMVYFARSVDRHTSYKGEYVRLNVDITLNDEIFEFLPDSGMVKVTDGTNTAYLGTGIFGEEGGEKTYFDVYKSVAGDIYEGDNGNTTTTYGGKLNLWDAVGADYSTTGSYNSDVDYYFSGIFDGGNHIVSGIYSDGETEGLFGHIKDGTVKNVRVKNSYICSYSVSGGIVAYARGASIIENCSSDAIMVTTTDGNKDGSGGIVGYFELTSTGNAYIRNCSSSGAIGNASNAGGIVGYVTSESTPKAKGISINITDCYNNAKASTYYYGGGIIGMTGRSSICNITNCYNVGKIVVIYASGGLGGGIVGKIYRYYTSQSSDYDAVVSFTNCYYKEGCATNKSGTTIFNGVNTAEDVSGIKALTEAELLNQASYAGFDFNNVWSMDVSADYPYPVLRALNADAVCIHDYLASVTAPTCTEQGYTTHTCRYCKDSYDDTYTDIVPHNHIPKITYPTCVDEGYTTYTCDGCGDSYVDSYVPAAGHNPGKAASCYSDQTCTICGEVLVEKYGHSYEITVCPPSCTYEGYTSYYCVLCGNSYKDSYVPETGHSAGAEATCTENQTCTVCGDVIVGKYGHNYISVITEPTCTKQGYTTYTCDRCGDSYVDDFVPENGHAPGEDPTCTENQTCTVCGEILAEMYGHNYIPVITDPTCTEEGYTTNTCDRCGDSYVDNYVPANGHTPGEEPTCTENQTCTVCGEILAEMYGHNHIPVITEPTCTEQGYTTHTCDRCGDSYTDDYVSAKGHSAGEEATCTTDQACTVCGEILVGRYGHNYIPIITSPTCTEQGYTTHTCHRCGDSYTDNFIPENGHAPGEDPTCTENQTCTVCGEILAEMYGHNYIPVITEPTCTEEGYTTNTCDRCGDSYVDNYVPANGHTPGEEPTCTENQTCTVCGEILAEMYGHNHIPEITEPTCTEQGYTTHTCDRCGDSYVDSYVPENGHTPEGESTCTTDQICGVCGEILVVRYGHNYIAVVTAPTCKDSGYTTYTCDRCGDSYIDDYVPAKGHTEGEWKVIIEPEIGVEGQEEQRCTECGELLGTRPIDPLEPEFILGDVNLDGEIDKKDYAVLKRYCFGTAVLNETQLLASDVNGDGEIDKKDYALLKRYCFGTATLG